jgi:protein-S-isoprenylcysteine O-methyltransferase Ste14
VVEGGCEESAGVCKESVVGNSGGKEVAPVAGSGGAEGDETQDSISVESAQGGVVGKIRESAYNRGCGRIMNALENKVPPPIVALLVGAVMWGIARWSPLPEGESPLRVAISGGLACLGILVVVLGMLAFRRAKTTINPVNIKAASSMVTSGVYRYTRNPMYVGLTLALVGWAVHIGVPFVLVGPVIFMLFITRFQIIPEERVLTSKFGEEYRKYREQVRRWL